MTEQLHQDHRRGVGYALFAYGTWGLFPLFWPLLKPASSVEILAHRMLWSLVFLVGVNSVRANWREIWLVLRNPRFLRLLGAAAVLITINWGLYIWAVNANRVVDASLGYFINPLINVAMGVLVFREKLRRTQWLAVGLAGVGVLWLTLNAGAFPWIGLTLGFTFATYGMVKKVAGVDAVESLTVETLLLMPFALGYLVWAEAANNAAFLHAGFWQAVFTMSAGVVTAVPLLAFGAATIRIPYSLIGLIQFMTPSMQFFIGVTVFGEALTASRWFGFCIIWAALILFSTDAWRNSRKPKNQ